LKFVVGALAPKSIETLAAPKRLKFVVGALAPKSIETLAAPKCLKFVSTEAKKKTGISIEYPPLTSVFYEFKIPENLCFSTYNPCS
ncbi:MAG: hypothetical protein DRR08_23690, partial [Candidatus Parabeggiatoa sp. nov. 2]